MYKREFTSERITELKPNEIFVFGSNLAGAHGGGAACLAYNRFGAIWGKGVGLQGQSYAIPTMQGGVETIKPYVDEFIEFAGHHQELKFLVTRIGCGIAAFTPDEIAPLFIDAIDVENVILPKDFVDVLSDTQDDLRPSTITWDAEKDFLEKFYKEKNGREQSDEYAYIKKNVTANGFQILKDLYDFECDGECLATWAFDYEEGSDIGDFKSRNILSQDDNNFLVESEYEYAKYSVLLTVVKEGDTYKIDRIEQKGTISLVSEQMKTENLDWLQGHWVYQQGNYKGHFVIQGNTLTMYSSMNPEPLTYTYRVEGNELFAGEMTVKLNFGSQTIDYGDGNWMQKVE